ncbi:MAG: histidine kinase [Chitinophagaceae bacterium]|nr:histidine kinase [Chitinophagaceae bacterium]
MKFLTRHIILLYIFCQPLISNAQTTQILRYTTKEGLPSNSIYRSIIDRKGFLWIAGESGLSRFDGRTFKNYFTTEGLPDNEVTELQIDNSGRLWALAFRKKPSWYNEKKDRFENSDTDPELDKIETGNTSITNVLKYDGIAFCNDEKSIFIYKDGKVTAMRKLYSLRKGGKPETIINYQPGKYVLVCMDSLRYIENGKISRTIPFGYSFFWCEHYDNSLYILQQNGIRRFHIDENGNIVNMVSQTFPFTPKVMCRTRQHLALTSVTGNTYTADTSTLALKENIFSQFIIRSVTEDHNGNFWLATKDEGLIKIQQKRISSFTENKELIRNFNTILKTGNIFAGNNKGELYIYDGLYNTSKIMLTSAAGSSDTWVRNMLDLGSDIYVATQTGSFIIDKKTQTVKRSFLGPENKSTKAAGKLNDSTLLLGGHAQLFVYHLPSGKFTDSILKRVTAIGTGEEQKIYIGSIDGLYRKDRDSLYYFGKQYKALTYRIVSILNTRDRLLWIGRSSDSILVLKDDEPVAAIPLGTVIPGKVCKVLYSRKPGEVWIGTDKGLNRLQYAFADNKLTYTNLYFSTADGLIGDQVNDITISNDTAYVATTGGISYLPAGLQLPLSDIATFITRVSVNNTDTAVLDNYALPFSKNNILIEFSSVDLTGFNPIFEYSINNSGWIRAQNNFLSLQNQPPGKYNIRVRSLRRDGTPSTQEAAISFRIRTPFWRNPLFWGSLAMAGFILILVLVQRRNRSRQQIAIEKITTEKKLAELEMQALKAQINPHFVFNCLNSIKGFIYDKDYLQADKYLDKFSELMRNTIDNSDASVISLEEEVHYLDNYLQLEKLRFSEKFDYRIQTAGINDPKTIFVPAMLLQPYVENAIRHGIRFLEGRKGLITIAAVLQNDLLVCSIDDNGIGREKAAALKSRHHIEYQGRGMSISKRRAELYQIEQEVVDKKDEAGNSSGTTIILKIPAGLKP